MKKKSITFVLALVMLLTFIPNAGSFAMNVDDDMALIDTEVFTVKDELGNEHEIILEEYGYKNESGIRPNSMFPEYEVGTPKSYVFKISNEALGIPEIAKGSPFSKAAKEKMEDILVKKLGEKIGGSILPGLSLASWVSQVIGATNAVVGNNGFKVTVDVEYSSTYYNRGGYYVYGWDFEDISVRTY